MTVLVSVHNENRYINAELVQQTKLFNRLRIDNSDLGTLEESCWRLGEIKRELTALKPGRKDAKKRERLLLKTPKGTHDYGAGKIFCHDCVECIVKECFMLYGGAQLDTPVFERKDILTGKYGKDAKLIFDLEDQCMVTTTVLLWSQRRHHPVQQQQLQHQPQGFVATTMMPPLSRR
ncbi:hypothetical protein EDB85DRAFT_2154616 [Lactarius pseudohatsudake]|nr:hypothetical protein EDB85DRAFT_2154616 [Lactarius pseudohatsudake]